MISYPTVDCCNSYSLERFYKSSHSCHNIPKPWEPGVHIFLVWGQWVWGLWCWCCTLVSTHMMVHNPNMRVYHHPMVLETIIMFKISMILSYNSELSETCGHFPHFLDMSEFQTNVQLAFFYQSMNSLKGQQSYIDCRIDKRARLIRIKALLQGLSGSDSEREKTIFFLFFQF